MTNRGKIHIAYWASTATDCGIILRSVPITEMPDLLKDWPVMRESVYGHPVQTMYHTDHGNDPSHICERCYRARWG